MVSDHAFETIGVDRLISLVRPENLASCRVAEKIGMQVERDTIYGTGDFLHQVYAVAAPGRRHVPSPVNQV